MHRRPVTNKGALLVARAYYNATMLLRESIPLLRVVDEKKEFERMLASKERRRLLSGSKHEMDRITDRLLPSDESEFPAAQAVRLRNFVSYKLLRFLSSDYISFMSSESYRSLGGPSREIFQREHTRSVQLSLQRR